MSATKLDPVGTRMSIKSSNGTLRGSASRASNLNIIAATAVNAAFVLSLQLLGLVSLAPAEFGVFSIQYLLFALAASVSLSVICEPWLRTDLHENHRSSWRDYSSFLVYISTGAGLATGLVSQFVPDLRVVAVSGTVAVVASTYRSGARFYQVRTGRWRHVLWADVTGLTVTALVWVLTYAAGAGALTALSVAWALGAVASASFPPWPKAQRLSSLGVWVSTHKRQIGPLLRDSLLMDLGALGTPFAMAPVLGIASFGIYRAVSNVAAPVRLVLNPLRPSLASVPLITHRSHKRSWAIVGVSTVFGAAAYGALVAVDSIKIDLGSLTALVPFAAPTGIFVAASFLGHYYYIVARAHTQGGYILIGRIVQTVLSVVLPLFGAMGGGLAAAIWGYVLATTLSAIAWSILVLNSARPR